MDSKRRSLFRMKRAQSHITRSGALTLQTHVLADHINNVELALKLFRKIHLKISGGGVLNDNPIMS